MYLIRKKFKFDAAHHLEGLREGHKCGNPHGHTYNVEIAVEAESVTEEGWVIDFNDFDPIKEYIDNQLDHQDLNKVLPFQTTSENLAKHFYYMTVELVTDYAGKDVTVAWVRVSETESTYAEYRQTRQIGGQTW